MGEFEIVISARRVLLRQFLGDESDPEAAVEITLTHKNFDAFLKAIAAAGWKQPKKASVGSDEGFPEFRAAYPRHEVMFAAQKVWREQGLDELKDVILSHVEKMKSTADWIKNGGVYVPYPVKYLSERRWEGAQEPDDMVGVK